MAKKRTTKKKSKVSGKSTVRPAIRNAKGRIGRGAEDEPTSRATHAGQPLLEAAGDAIGCGLNTGGQNDVVRSWMFYPFVLSSFLPSDVSGVTMMFDGDVENVFRDEYHEGHIAFVHGFYDSAPTVRAFVRFGCGPRGEPYWVLERTDGPKVAAKYPVDRAADCFEHLLEVLRGFQAAVNSSPFSASYCHIEPSESIIEAKIAEVLKGRTPS